MKIPDPVVIAVGGENLIDTVSTALPGGEIRQRHNLGGSPYNVAVAMARQDVEVRYLTPISTDDFGTRLADNLTREGVGIAAPRRAEPTTQAVITLDNGVPSYVFHRDGTAERCVSAQSIAAAMPEGATHFHAGSLAFAGGADAQAWEAAFLRAGKEGRTTSLDPNVRALLIEDVPAFRARMQRLMQAASILKLSDEDLEFLYPDMPQAQAIATLRAETGAHLIALTKGPDGAECWTPRLHCATANPVVPDLKDTIGAGDTFMATLLASLAAQGQLSLQALAALAQEDLERLLRRAVHAACLNCAREGRDPPGTAAIDAALALA